MFHLTNQNVIDFDLKRVGTYFESDGVKVYLILSADNDGYVVAEVDEHGRVEGYKG